MASAGGAGAKLVVTDARIQGGKLVVTGTTTTARQAVTLDLWLTRKCRTALQR